MPSTHTTWHAQAPQLPAPQLPAALELRSANAGKGWAQIGPPGDPTSSRTVAVVFADPTVDASDTEIYRGHTVGLVISGTGFPSSQVKIGDKWTDITTSPVVYFDPPINPELVDVEVHVSVHDFSTAFRYKRIADVQSLLERHGNPFSSSPLF